MLRCNEFNFKKEADVSGLFDLGPAALLKLREKSSDVTKITKKEMRHRQPLLLRCT